jgi:Phosphoesterase family
MRSTLSARGRALGTATVLFAALALPFAGSAVPAATAAAAAVSPDSPAVRVPHYNHIAVIMDLDHDYASIMGNRYAPNINRLAHQYGLASRYYTTSDPDTANIMALLAGNSFGIADGLPYWDQQVHKSSLLSQLAGAHKTWKEYAQDLPYPGYLGSCYPTLCIQTDSLYNQTQFNSVLDLASVVDNPAQVRNVVPAAELGADARGGRLPAFSYIVPSECADMHGGPPWCEDSASGYHQFDDNALVSAGDSYIGQVVREIMSGPQWRHGNNAIVITFTEGDTSAGCCDVKTGTGHVVTIVITSHGPRRLSDPTPFNHYSLLRTIENAFGLPCLRHACDKGLVPMAKLFGAAADPVAGQAVAVPAGPAAARSRPGTAATPSRGRAAAALVPASPWKQVLSPNAGPNDNDLAAIAGRSPSDIWAVGGFLPTASATIVRALSVHYNGSAWAYVRTPDVGSQANSLDGVAALPDGTAWAVGIYTQASGHAGRALTEHWDGHRWAIVPAANPGSQDDMLYGVTAVSDHDVWAVGTDSGADGFFHPLIEHWNGRRWSAVSVPGLHVSNGILTSVSHAGGHGVWAAGQLAMRAPDRQVILHLARGSWAVAEADSVRTRGGSAASAYPQAIAGSAAGLWLAGSDRAGRSGFATLVEAPARGRLTRELVTPDPTPHDNYLQGVAPVRGGAAAWAVGYTMQVSTGNAASLIQFGSARGGWKSVPSPDPGAANGGNTFIDGVLAFGAGNVWAVGTYDGPNSLRTLILHYTGGAS